MTMVDNSIPKGIRYLLLDAFFVKGALTILDQCCVSGTNFLTGVIIARTCGKEQFGLYVLGFSMFLFFSISLQQSLIISPYTIFGPRLKGKEHFVYMGSTLIHQIGLSLLAVVTLALISGVILARIGLPQLEPVGWSLCGTIPLILLKEYARRICFAELKIHLALFMDVSVAIIQIGTLMLLAQYNLLSPSRSFVVIGAACGFASLAWLIRNRKSIILEKRQIALHLYHNCMFGKWVFGTSLAELMGAELYPWCLTMFYGTTATGVLAVCIGVVSLISPFVVGVQNLLGPKMARAFTETGTLEIRKMAINTTIFLAVIVGVFCVIMITMGDRIVLLIYGEKYAGNGSVVSVLALSVYVLTITIPEDYGIWAMERPDLNFKINFIVLLIAVSFGLFLAKSLGPLGAAFGLLIARITAATFRSIVFTKLFRVSELGNKQ